MFIIFEGIDGSGKTTLSNLVAKQLRARGLTVKHLRAEGKFVSNVSEAIRTLTRDAKNVQLVPQVEFLLYVARDVQLLEESLRDALNEHDVVIADRFLYTAEALARYGRRLPAAFTRPILQAVSDLKPDLVVLVDVDPVLARARRKAAKIANKDPRPPSRKGLTGVGLQHRLRKGYLELASESKERFVVVNNEQALDRTCAQVCELIARAISCGSGAAIREFSAQAPAASVRPAATLRSTDQALSALLAWVDQRAAAEPHVAAYMLAGMYGPGIDERRRALARRVPEVVLSGLNGETDAVSWELRDQLCAEHPAAVARSLSGLPGVDERTHALRRRLLAHAPTELLRGLAQLDDEPVWDLRTRLYDTHASAVVASLAGLGSERAWDLRARWLACYGGAIPESYDLSRVAARSVHELPDEQAWHIRELAQAAAPMASLASIGGLLDARSWALRERYLRPASKVVMETLRRIAHPRAYEMRKSVAADTKEAIDSISGLDDDDAWQLRSDYAAVWPSTVVKSLSALADGPRGHELVTMQLARYPSNVSLLKHAAAIALGLHRQTHTEGLEE